MKLVLFSLVLFMLYGTTSAQSILDYKKNHSQTYANAIRMYQDLADRYKGAKLVEAGQTDCGKPLHLFIIDADGDFNPENGKLHLLINNGIHPGEPCGIDASIKFANDLLASAKFKALVQDLTICIIPVYNIGGALNRGCCSRANQNGPEEYGFRGNARNLDLNRDFVKLDSENARSFTKIFQKWNPDILVDTHTSNGADYQYVLTLITTQLDKLNPVYRSFMKDKMLPTLYGDMDEKGFPMVPYVHSIDQTPDNGIYDYLETPRYATGYAAQFNTIGFTTETHMWKPFPDRVESTYAFLNTIRDYASTNASTLKKLRKMAFDRDAKSNRFPLNYVIDTSQFDLLSFKGYEVETYNSAITGLPTYRFNRDKPYEKDIRYYNRYTPIDEITQPKFYLIPQAWKETINRLKWNKIEMQQLERDTTLVVTGYYLDDSEMQSQLYEGHYFHKGVRVQPKTLSIQFAKGDYLISTNQKKVRFIIEQLEPHAVDSYFAWNYFDAVLGQKEYFSAYIFEQKAEQMLEENPQLKKELEKAKKENKQLRNNHWMQLYFLYQQSENYEPTHKLYPVYRIE